MILWHIHILLPIFEKNLLKLLLLLHQPRQQPPLGLRLGRRQGAQARHHLVALLLGLLRRLRHPAAAAGVLQHLRHLRDP